MHMDFFISLFCCIMQNKQNLTTRNELWFMKWNSNLLEELRKSEEVQWESLVIYENHKRSKYSMQSMKTKFENKKFSLFSLVREQNYTKEHIFLAGKSEEKQEHTWICCFCRLRRRRDCAQEDAEEDWSFNGSRRERKARKQKVSVRYSSNEFFTKKKLGEKKGEKKVNEY